MNRQLFAISIVYLKITFIFRNLILIRHGQYNLDGESDAERYLTQLGQDQAKMTGMRLGKLER